MRVTVHGCRGSLPSPGADRLRYGGNTCCLQVTLSDGTNLILDAGTGIRNVPSELGIADGNLHIMLTHLHLDHIQGLLFFSALFQEHARVTIWGPQSAGASLKQRIARYLSAPLAPVDVRELPCRLEFRDCPVSEWAIGSARVRAEAVLHRGPTLGFRIEDGDTSLCYLPDHEPALVGPVGDLQPDWISGFSLAHDADLLVHDCQYTDAEYPMHLGWGHSALSHAIGFAARSGAARTLLFHHDPQHSDDELDAVYERALEDWRRLGGAEGSLGMGHEGEELTVQGAGGANGAAPDALELASGGLAS